MDPAEVRRWVAGFDALEAADRRRLAAGPDPAWAIALSLSVIEAAEHMLPARADPQREADDAVARATWGRLRRALAR